MTQSERILWILNDRQPHSHHEFYGFCVLHSRISELRKKGHQIRCWREGDLYLYQLQDVPQAPAARGDAVPAPMGLPESESTSDPLPSVPRSLAAEGGLGGTFPPKAASPAHLVQPTLWESAA